MRVDFLHRTVRDFLRESASVQELFEKSLKHERESTAFLACCTMARQIDFVLYVKTLREEEVIDSVHDLFFFANLAMRDQKRRVTWEEVEKVLTVADVGYRRVMKHHKWIRGSSAPIFLGLAAQYNFQLYVRQQLRKMGAIPTRQTGRPILDYALVPSSGQSTIEYSEVVVELLLNSGADANQPYKKSTVWLRFISALANRQIEADRGVLVQIITALVTHRAVMSQETIPALKNFLSLDEQPLIFGLPTKPVYVRRDWQQIKQTVLHCYLVLMLVWIAYSSVFIDR
ncbi:hypothetical protein F5Y14DRAFT_454290 [Nemania sp. NC0429]|nr:hypothetical protein F5Y14DRAFT_454290 [Nemania sp. NC0429]